MACDRIDGTGLPFTHEFLALMLGVRRPDVTTVLQKLQHCNPPRCNVGLDQIPKAVSTAVQKNRNHTVRRPICSPIKSKVPGCCEIAAIEGCRPVLTQQKSWTDVA